MHKAVKQGLERLPDVYYAVSMTQLVKESFLQVLGHSFFRPKREIKKHTRIKIDTSVPTSLVP